MTNGLIAVAKGVLGFATTVFLFLYVFIAMWWWQRYADIRMRSATEQQKRRFTGGMTVFGAVIIWLIWRYVLPEWWIESTLLLSDGD